jgi:DNA-binding CsgD family transcriptional regulator
MPSKWPPDPCRIFSHSSKFIISFPRAISILKNTKALSHIRQLCNLGVESHSVMPAVMQALHTLIPSSHNVFIWTNRQGEPIDRYCEVYSPAAQSAYAHNLAGKPDLAAIARDGKPVGNMQYRAPEFYASPYYNEVHRPMRARRSLDAVVRTASGTQGVLVLHRDSDVAFTEAEARDLEGILPYLRHIWTLPGDHSSDIFAETADHGTIICDGSGRVHFRSTSASQMLLMAQTQGVLSKPAAPADLPIELLAIVHRLLDLRASDQLGSVPALQVRNRWGQFVFRAMWLDGTVESATPGGFSGSLVSISVWRQEPLAVSVVRGFQDSPLSPKQRDVALRLVVGRSAEEIVTELSISTTTYKDHLRKIYDKLGISKRSDLIRQLTQPALV